MEHTQYSNTYQQLRESALAYRNAGLSVIPVEKSKQPAIKWKQYQISLAGVNELNSWWQGAHSMMAIVCGQVSGKLECLDFDEKYHCGNTSIFSQWESLVEQSHPGLVARLPRQKTMNNGYHIFYRCSVIEGNRKLTRREPTEYELNNDPATSAKTLIETRGEGGYVLCSPSRGYTMLNGSLCSIPEITPDEREALFSSAIALSTSIEESLVVHYEKSNKKKNRPGDAFNKSGDHRSLLEQHGWFCVADNAERELWRRPGKSHGISASYLKNKGYFYVFTSNAQGLEPNKAYDKFALFAHLESNGNYTGAASQLAEKGFGDTERRTQSAETIKKLRQCLNERYEFRLNVVTNQVEFRKLDSSNFCNLSDYDLNTIEAEVRLNNIPAGIDVLARQLYSEFTREYNPFKDYFESLPVWDGKQDYIQDLCASVEMFSDKDVVHFYCCLIRWLIGVVGCAVDDAVINQNAIIFVGRQGIGKSRWLNKLVPDALSKYKFIGTINPENKDTQIYLSECLMINLDELETLKRSDIGTLKSVMTLPMIKVRRPYERTSKDIPRRASFVGSINQNDFLNDPTGARRFLTFEVKSFDFERIPDMDLVMSQAYTMYKSGEKWWFNDAEMAIINERNKRYSITSYEEELLLQYTSSEPALPELTWKTATEIAGHIKSKDENVHIDARFIRNLGVALTKHEYRWKKGKGVKQYAVRWLS